MRQCQHLSWCNGVDVVTFFGQGLDDLILLDRPPTSARALGFQHPAGDRHALLCRAVRLVAHLGAEILDQIDQFQEIGVSFRPVVQLARLALQGGLQITKAVGQLARRADVQRADRLAPREPAPRPVFYRGLVALLADGLDRRLQFDLVVVQAQEVGAPHVDPIFARRLDDRHGNGCGVRERHMLEEGSCRIQRPAGVEHQLLVLLGGNDAASEFPVEHEYLVAAAGDDVRRSERAGDAGEPDARLDHEAHRLAKALFLLGHEGVEGAQGRLALVGPQVCINREGPAFAFRRESERQQGRRLSVMLQRVAQKLVECGAFLGVYRAFGVLWHHLF